MKFSATTGKWLADDVAAFLRQPAHRNIRVDLEERVSPEIVRGVQEGRASLGVCWDAAETRPLRMHPHRQDTLCVAVPDDHPLAVRDSLRFEAALRVVHAGLAISLVPREVAHEAALALRLRLIPLDETWAERRFVLCYRDAASLTPAAQALTEYLAPGAVAATS